MNKLVDFMMIENMSVILAADIENTPLRFWRQGILPYLQKTVQRYLSGSALSVPFDNMLSNETNTKCKAFDLGSIQSELVIIYT